MSSESGTMAYDLRVVGNVVRTAFSSLPPATGILLVVVCTVFLAMATVGLLLLTVLLSRTVCTSTQGTCTPCSPITGPAAFPFAPFLNSGA